MPCLSPFGPSVPAVHAQLPTLEGPICLQSNEVIRFLWFLITSSRSPILHFDMVCWWKAIWKSINQVLSHILLPDSNHPLLTWHLWSENISMTKMRIKIAWAYMRCGKHCEVLTFIWAIIRSGFWHYFGVHFWNRPLWNPPWYKAESKKRSMLDNRIRTATDWNVKEMIKW